MKLRGSILTVSALGTVVLSAIFAGIGCRQSPQDDRPAAPQKLDIDTLRSMPYAGSARIAGDEGEGVVFAEADRVCPGYNLYTIQPLSTAELIDNEGNVVRSWHEPDSERWVRAVLLPGGDLIVIGAEPTAVSNKTGTGPVLDEARCLARYDWNGKRLWKSRIAAHHDIAPIPGERFLTITLQRRVIQRVNPKIETRDDLLTMLDENGAPLESLSVFDAIERNPRAFRLARVKPSSLGGEPWVDLFHANSVQWIGSECRAGIHPAHQPGNLLVCFRHQNRIAVFDWKEKRVVWSWGKNELDGPHDAQVLPDGNILIFDNGLARDWSRVIELDPDTEKMVWTYQADPPEEFYTASKGSAQRLPNGNTLIAESDRGRAFEVTLHGDIVWEFICPHRVTANDRAAMVRMRRLPESFVQSIMNRENQPTTNSDIE